MAIIAGRTPSLQSRGYSGWLKPTLWRVSLERVPTNWRAGCGRSACPVRREGESHGFLPTPIGRTPKKRDGQQISNDFFPRQAGRGRVREGQSALRGH